LCSISLFVHADQQTEFIMDAIEVEAVLDPPVIINPTRTSTSFSLEEIEKRQAGNIFEIIDDIPGVSLSGGPRSSGIDIDIRGFGNNEDVIIKLDGAIKNFEKYRFGGTFVEPELLKSIEVTRGAATTAIGSGALGGVVEMETKDASDFLKPGQSFGVNTKVGHRFNNDERVNSLTLFAAPTKSLDLLFNITDREANDYNLTGSGIGATSNNLAASSTVPSSGLAKLEYYPNDDITLGLSFSRYLTSGIEPFDTRVSGLGGFGTVDRDSDDKTYTGKFLYNPISDLIDFKLTVGYSDIHVTDVDQGDNQFFLDSLARVEQLRQSVLEETNPVIKDILQGILEGQEASIAASDPTGDIETFEYDIWSFDVKNTGLVELGSVSNIITLGIDGEYSERETSQVDISLMPDSFGNRAQPSGIYQQYGIYFVNEIQLGNFTLTPSMRWDYNHTRVTFGEGINNTVDLLRSVDQDTSESFDIFLPSLSTSYKIGKTPFTVFYNYWEQYRPPKVDEYFAIGGFSRCTGGITEEPFATTSACGSLFKPEKSVNNDIGLLIQKDNLLGNDKLLAKLTFFDTKVRNVLEFLNNDPDNPGLQLTEEDRDGFEVEINYARKNFSVNIGYSEIDGEIEGYFLNDDQIPFVNGGVPSTSPLVDQVSRQKRPIYNLPGDTLTVSANFAVPKYNLDFGWRGQHVDERLGLNTDLSANGVPERFDSYFVQDVWANWRPFDNSKLQNSVLRFGIDNVGNKRYRTNTEGGVGNFGVARNVKVTFSLDF